MNLLKYRMLHYSEVADEVDNSDGSARIFARGFGNTVKIPLQKSIFEDSVAMLEIKNPVDVYDTESFSVAQPESYLVQDSVIRTGYGAVTIGDLVARESLSHFPWFLYPQFRINDFQEDGVVCVLPDSPPDIELSFGFSVCNGINGNYYHWLILFLGRLSREGLQVWSDKIHCKPTLIFPTFENQLQYESAAVLAEHYGVPFLSLGYQASVQTKNLVVSETMRSGGVVPHPVICESLNILKRHYYKIDDYPENIYISRRDTSNRKILNEDIIEEMFKGRGYKILTLENLSLSEQINYFAHAKKIVGPHGAGLTNICFAEPGARLLEICLPNHLNWCYRRLAAVCGLNYQYILLSLKDDAPHVNNCTYLIDPIKVELCFEYGF